MILGMFKLILIISLIFVGCSEREYPKVVPDVELSDRQELITFKSKNPFSFKDIIVNLESQSIQDVYGVLTFPKTFDSKKRYPLVIGVAGSMGWRPHHLDYMKMYQSMGIATLELHSFRSRGVTSTVGTQIEVTTAMMVLDAYKALESLSSHKNIDISRLLMTNGAKLGLKDRLGRTSIHWAAEKGDLAIAKLLLTNGAKIDSKDNDGETALHEAAQWGHLNLIQFFIGQGANVNAVGSDGRSPIHIAIAHGNIDIVNLLKKYGAVL